MEWYSLAFKPSTYLFPDPSTPEKTKSRVGSRISLIRSRTGVIRGRLGSSLPDSYTIHIHPHLEQYCVHLHELRDMRQFKVKFNIHPKDYY